MSTVSANPPRSFTLNRVANLDAQTASWHKVGAARATRVMSNELADDVWLSSSNADWIPPHPDTFPPFTSIRSDGFRGHHEPSRVPQLYSDARPWLAYMWSREAEDPARLSLVRDKKVRTVRWTPDPRQVAILPDTAQALIDEYEAARTLAEEVDIRLLDNQHRIPADLRLDDAVFEDLRYGRRELHDTLITAATVQRAIIELRGFALWASYTLAFRAGFITQQEALLPVVGCCVQARDTHIWEALTYGGVPCWRRTAVPPKDPAAYHVPLGRIPPDLATDDWDDDIHHPRPEHTYGKKERKVRAEIAELEAKGKHWDAMEARDAFDGFSQRLTWDERTEARREMQGDSPSPEPRTPAPPRRPRAPRRGRRRSRSRSPRRMNEPYRRDGRLRDPPRRRDDRSARAWCRSPSPGPSHRARGSDRPTSRSYSPPPLARRMARDWRSPSPRGPRDRSPHLLRRLRDASPFSRSPSPRAESPPRRYRSLSLASARSPFTSRAQSATPPRSVTRATTSTPGSPMAVSIPPASPPPPPDEPIAPPPDLAAALHVPHVLVLSDVLSVRTSLDLSITDALAYARIGWWDGAIADAPLASWELLTHIPAYMDDPLQFPVPPPSCLDSDRALYVWRSISPAYVTSIASEPPSAWKGGRIKEWKSRLRPKGRSGHALRNLPSLAPTAEDVSGLTDLAGQPWVVLDERARADIRWAARTFLFRRDVERLAFARVPGAPLWPANHALFSALRTQLRRACCVGAGDDALPFGGRASIPGQRGRACPPPALESLRRSARPYGGSESFCG
ncbi:hypothetical protein FA95DRAFT_1609490 [Auriscalpium vulgare]|uniref:Uncharacterized protein n=1 Tax=Auriscalpium vulgare TaxID=40419 RepID=A0ACB8RHE5_9AGAM|nr:hypothetical protein FA95DRAFT_1609490 [Auriscalpium vulgare]